LPICPHGRRDFERLFLLSVDTNVHSIGPFRCPGRARLTVQSPERLVGIDNFVVIQCREQCFDFLLLCCASRGSTTGLRLQWARLEENRFLF
jgi:hypothetical protein